MEKQKKTYLASFTKRVGPANVETMKETIKDEERNIRGSYRESTEWVLPESFVKHILKDAVFIMEFIIRVRGADPDDKIVDNTIDHDKLSENTVDTSTVKQDLMLLENQLPYFIFEKLFGSVMSLLVVNETVEEFILNFFSLKIKTKNFMHFTDMFRCAYEESLDHDQSPNLKELSGPAIEKMENADNLSSVGVEFKTFDQWNSSERNRSHDVGFLTFNLCFPLRDLIPTHGRKNSGNPKPLETIAIGKEADDPEPLETIAIGKEADGPEPSETIAISKEADDYSLRVEFKKGCLLMSSFRVAEDSDTILRNVIAYEQCHANITPYISNYIHFINFLITSARDVAVLTAEGVLTTNMGNPSLVVGMVNDLNRGLKTPRDSQYHNIAMNLRAHYKSGRKRCRATLHKVYFKDVFTGTATIGGILLLFLTLVGTVASVIQAYKSFKDVPVANTPQLSPNLN